LRDAGAIGALPAEIRKPVSGDPSEAVQRLREHQRQRVFARSLPPRKHHRMRKALARQHIAQAMNRFRIAVKIRKRHKLYLTTEDTKKNKKVLNREAKRRSCRAVLLGAGFLCVPC